MSDEGERDRNDDGDEEPRFVVLRGGDALLEVDDARVFLAYIRVRHRNAERGAAEEIVLNPLPLLRANLEGIGTLDEGWTVTVNRVNAEEPIHNPGPHHLLVNGLILDEKKQVHCTVHRSVEDPKKRSG
jgi:hypothetical protein